MLSVFQHFRIVGYCFQFVVSAEAVRGLRPCNVCPLEEVPFSFQLLFPAACDVPVLPLRQCLFCLLVCWYALPCFRLSVGFLESFFFYGQNKNRQLVHLLAVFARKYTYDLRKQVLPVALVVFILYHTSITCSIIFTVCVTLAFSDTFPAVLFCVPYPHEQEKQPK